MVVVNRCWLCKSDEESVDHLLFYCGAARALWNALFAQFGLCWVMPCLVKKLFVSWWSSGCLGALLCGKWFLSVLCGVFGESKMLDVLRILRGLVRSSSTFFFLPYSLGQQVVGPAGD
jgi:hypothetical protein